MVSRVLLCQGKLYYELSKRRDEQGLQAAALVRLEQLYPFPADQVGAQLERYAGAEVWWVQEEPENMGAWSFVRNQVADRLGIDVKQHVAREESASPATGSLTVHQQEQAVLLDRAFAGL